MATRSRIGILNPDSSITSIYCHYDGYLKGVGQTLVRHYKDEDKIRALISLGDISYLEPEVSPPDGAGHSFDAPIRGVTVAYGRDRGETGVGAATHSVDHWPSCGAEFLYLYNPDSKEWQFILVYMDKSWKSVNLGLCVEALSTKDDGAE